MLLGLGRVSEMLRSLMLLRLVELWVSVPQQSSQVATDLALISKSGRSISHLHLLGAL